MVHYFSSHCIVHYLLILKQNINKNISNNNSFIIIIYVGDFTVTIRWMYLADVFKKVFYQFI